MAFINDKCRINARGFPYRKVLDRHGEQLKPLDQEEHSKSYLIEYSSNGKH